MRCQPNRQHSHTTLLRFDDGGVYVAPYNRNVHLLPDSAEALGLDFGDLPRLAGGRTKASFTPDEHSPDSRRIDRIVVLNPSRDCTQPTLSDLHGVQRLNVLREHVLRSKSAISILGPERLFTLLTDLVAAVPVAELIRPKGGWSLDEVVRLIEDL